ncbi:MAG: CoA pyrophosphatase [Pseudomonadota bacterium]
MNRSNHNDASLAQIEQALARETPQREAPGASTRQAAVAIVLRPEQRASSSDTSLELLFIKRAEKEGDPWSGHMAFPGGHREPSDPSLRSAAVRETCEEVGIDLARQGRYLGAVDQQRAAPRGRPLDMIIAPEVFVLEEPVTATLNHEVEDTVWVPLPALLDNRWHATRTYPMAGTPTVFNGFLLPEQDYFIWGLTYRMLKTFFRTFAPDWRDVDVD